MQMMWISLLSCVQLKIIFNRIYVVLKCREKNMPMLRLSPILFGYSIDNITIFQSNNFLDLWVLFDLVFKNF